MKSNKKKDKKEKVVYYDDNSTISDMSGVSGTFNPILPKKRNDTPKAPSRFKDKWNTYWQTFRLMLIPMLTVLGILFVLFLVMTGISNCVA